MSTEAPETKVTVMPDSKLIRTLQTLIVAVAFGLGWLMGEWSGCDKLERQAVNRGFGSYDPQGSFFWLIYPSPRQPPFFDGGIDG